MEKLTFDKIADGALDEICLHLGVEAGRTREMCLSVLKDAFNKVLYVYEEYEHDLQKLTCVD